MTILFQNVYTEIIENWKLANPLFCHSLGIHDYDGLLPDYSEQRITTRVQELRNDLEKLNDMSIPKDKTNLYNYELLKSVLSRELFELDVRKEYTTNPVVYIFPLAMIETSYTARNFDTVENRISSIIEIQKSIPIYLDQALRNFKESLPKAKIIMGSRFLVGIINYFKDRLIEFVSQSSNEDQMQQWSEANLTAIEAIEIFKQSLEQEYLPKAHNNFALGEQKFLELLNKQEGVSITVERLLEVGESDLERNYNALIDLSKNNGGLEGILSKITSDTPNPGELMEEAAKTLDRTKQFLIDSAFIDIPTDEQCKVIPTPEFARAFASGAMNTPGPFEKEEAKEAYYWVTPPNPALSVEKTAEYMKFFSKPMLEILTIHEAWPGHYLQLLFSNKSTNDIAKMFAWSTTMIEGWAHYTEEAIFDAGYEPFDRDALHGAQLLKALMRNVRYVSAVKMHCQGMNVEESAKLFTEKAFMTPIKSQLEANRGTIDPMYLSYTLGKLMIFKLRDDYKKEKEANKEDFSLKAFHNELLSYGSPPISVLRKLMLINHGDANDIL